MVLECRERAASLYSRLGFREAEKTFDMLLEGDRSVSQPLSCEIAFFQPNDLPALVEFDASYFGGQRLTILSAFAKDYPHRIFLARNHMDHITGYIIAENQHIGPWVAITASIAENLLQHALTLPFRRGPSLSIPERNTDGTQLITRYGFKQSSSRAFMYYGVFPSAHMRENIYGQASPALG